MSLAFAIYQTIAKLSSLIQHPFIYFTILWVGSLDWVQLGGSAAVGRAGLTHESVVSCRVLWGMTGLR